MRRPWVVLSVLALAFLFCSMPARAQTQISLGSSNNGITFVTSGGNLSMMVGVSGTATGQGSILGTTGTYTLTSAPIALTLGSSFSPVFADYSATGLVNFAIVPTSPGMALLTGTLKLVDLVQVASTGLTNTSTISDMTITGGTLAGDFTGNTGIAQLTIGLGGIGFLPNFHGSGSTSLSSGTFDSLMPTPEPWTMLLYGSGLILIGFVLRRRLTGEAVAAQA